MEFFNIVTWLNDEDPERWPAFWWIFGIGFFTLAAFIVLLWWILFPDYEPLGDNETPDLEDDNNKDAPTLTGAGSRDDNREESLSSSGSEPSSEREAVSHPVKGGDPFHVPTESEIGERAQQLSRWRDEAQWEASQDQDWILAERELYRQACGLEEHTDRAASYRAGIGREEIDGIESWEADELARLGFPSAAAIAGMTNDEKAKVSRWFKARGKPIDLDAVQSAAKSKLEDEKKTAASRGETRDYAGRLANSFAGESVSPNEDLGILYDEQPGKVDDLTEIKGVGEVIRERLNTDGVYRFKQIAHWNEHNATRFGERLDFPGRIEREEWIPQAKRLAKQEEERSNAPEEPEPDMPTDADYAGMEKNYLGEENLHVDPRLGLVFSGLANCEDDLTEISGIGKVLSRTLNENGVFRFQQIADWNEYNVWAFNQIISFPGRIQRDEWVRQAGELAPGSHCLTPGKARVQEADLVGILSSEFQGEDVEIREPFGIVYKSPPGEADNLQDIRGVGPVLEKKLHEFGVYRFKQIANWPEEAIDEFQEQLSFPDRIRRDNWVGQCEKLAGGETP